MGHVTETGTVVGPSFANYDALWVLAALVPLGVAAAAWALQMSCGFCSVEPPEFWHAVTTVVMIAVANCILRLALQMTGSAYGMGPQYLIPALATSAVIAVALPTTPFSAMTITLVQIILCVLIYFGLAWLQELVVSSFMML